MRKEYDFSQGVRGRHAGKRIRIVGDIHSRNGPDTAARIQQTIERDLKSREDFKVVWSELNPAERESIRAAWLKKISTVFLTSLPAPHVALNLVVKQSWKHSAEEWPCDARAS